MRLVSLLALLALSTPAIAQDAQPEAKPEKKICRRTGPATGSIMAGKPVCHTKAEWAAIDERNKTENGRILDRARQMEDARTHVL